ncbi:MAG TPA: GlsB/YeaQ/YmgE family stress response membrane protein [Polyangia bacterium]|nr:GlsB/YeaQ/YmgE family stress response membrane protein [Polyangia bacterium]
MNPSYGIIAWLIIGALVGWIGSKIMGTDKAMGSFGNILVGIVGGFIGGFIMRTFAGDHPGHNGLFASMLVALLGSCALIGTVKLVERHQ